MDITVDADKFGISIHAPARGATIIEHGFCALSVISIHAPARGATCLYILPVLKMHYFNPRSREGSDNVETICSLYLAISIHAPARGATIG